MQQDYVTADCSLCLCSAAPHLAACCFLFSFEQLQRISQTEQSQTFLAQRSNGQAFPIELTATEGTANRSRFFTIFIKDVSVRQEAEDNLRASRAQEKAKAIALENAMTQLKRAQAQLIQREQIPTTVAADYAQQIKMCMYPYLTGERKEKQNNV